MLRGGAEAGAVHGADHERGHRLAAEHVAELGRLVEDLVEADPHEVDEHQLGDGAKAGRGGTGGGADEGRFGDRRIENALAAEFAHQAFGDAERPAPGVVLAGRAEAAGDVLAHDDDARIAAHLVAQRLEDRLAVAFLAHVISLDLRRWRPPSSLMLRCERSEPRSTHSRFSSALWTLLRGSPFATLRARTSG